MVGYAASSKFAQSRHGLVQPRLDVLGAILALPAAQSTGRNKPETRTYAGRDLSLYVLRLPNQWLTAVASRNINPYDVRVVTVNPLHLGQHQLFVASNTPEMAIAAVAMGTNDGTQATLIDCDIIAALASVFNITSAHNNTLKRAPRARS